MALTATLQTKHKTKHNNTIPNKLLAKIIINKEKHYNDKQNYNKIL